MSWIKVEEGLPNSKREVLIKVKTRIDQHTFMTYKSIGFYSKNNGWKFMYVSKLGEEVVEEWIEIPQ